MDLIFMLTRDDQTVEDCLEVLEHIAPLNLGHIGFKDAGVSRHTLRELIRRIKSLPATCYLELVSLDAADCVASAELAVEFGVDCLLGGVGAEQIQRRLDKTRVAYFPFPGIPEGHPTRLRGSAERVAEDCRRFEQLGCQGVDLLAFRAVEAEPLALVRAARAALRGQLIVAGSIDSPGRLAELSALGVSAFTVGTAAFEGTFSARHGLLRSQLKKILDACR